MPRPFKKLTDTQIKKAKPPKLLVDGDGLAIRIQDTTRGITRTWVFNYYRPTDKKRTNMGLGKYPEVSLAYARDLREEYRAALARHIDPKDYREEKRLARLRAQENTFETVYREWLEIRLPEWSDSYKDRLTKAMELHVLPGLGTRPVAKITREEGKKLLQPIADKNAGETLNKLCRWCNEVFAYAIDCELITQSPFKTLRKSFKKHRHTNRPWIKPQELPVFLDKLDKASCSLSVKCLVLWGLHTMVRPAEAAGARWDEIDLAKRVWVIPADRMKGRKNPHSRKEKRVPHEVPLSDQTIEILEIMKPISQHRTHVFPSRSNPRSHMNSSTANVTIRRLGFEGYSGEEGEPGKLTAHGLRSTASTACNEAQFAPHVVEAALAHLDISSIKGTYDHASHLEQRRKMMQWWSNFIEQASAEKQPTTVKKHLRLA